jgi:hypothetical protein
MIPKTHNPVIDKWFNGREEYVNWRIAWKEAYAKLSAEIKAHKKERTDANPAVRCIGQGYAALKRVSAKHYMEVRKESKIDAQRQYLANKSQAPACKDYTLAK